MIFNRGANIAVAFLWLLVLLAVTTTSTAAFLVETPSNKQQGNENNKENTPMAASSYSRLLHKSRQRTAATSLFQSSQETEDTEATKKIDVVLFGVGDLRVDDHGGLYQALTRASSSADTQVLPLLILDDKTLANIPGAISHTIDTAKMLVAAIADLQQTLKQELDLDLKIVSTSDSLEGALVQVVQEELDRGVNVQVHVCDLGDADNNMAYGPFGSLKKVKSNLPDNLTLIPWANHLRERPWENAKSLPSKYPNYGKKYTATEPPLPPISRKKMKMARSSSKQATLAFNIAVDKVPTAEDIWNRLQSTLNLDPDNMQAEINTGLYQTHWGGLEASTIGESQVLKNLDIFVKQCQEEDEGYAQHPDYIAKNCPRNDRSLEHATFSWFLRGNQQERDRIETSNLLAGEPMIRYLAAPLMFGTLSPRRLWYSSTRQRAYFTCPLKTLVEGREWHNLLAAKNLRSKPEYQTVEGTVGETHYGYWRWHGFLCRYAQSPLTSSSSITSQDATDKEGVLFIHGFGASGTQWSKAMKDLSKIVDSEPEGDKGVMEALAPDLLGFGECQKPAISYSIYVWDAQVTDFIKEVAVSKQQWDSFIVGGNSIGGFSAASTAANECARADCGAVCSSGAPGTGKCKGVVLMNPAGPIQSREDVEQIEAQSGGDRSKLLTVAQVSATGGLPPCRPPTRPVARLLGNGLLAYLRPRIQSICKNLYPTNPSAVDKVLCDAIERDSLDPGAINVMISGAKLPPPRSMNEMLKADYGACTPESLKLSLPEVAFDGPVLVATGILDPLNDAKGRSEGLLALRDGIEFDPINAGHCPHDEVSQGNVFVVEVVEYCILYTFS